MEHTVNIGKHECQLRIGGGILLIGIGGLTALPEWGLLTLFGLGAIVIYTGIHHFCPLWKLFGINTREHPQDHH